MSSRAEEPEGEPASGATGSNAGIFKTAALDKITAIEEKIRVLHAMKNALVQLVEECSGQGEITDCPILAALDTEEKVHN